MFTVRLLASLLAAVSLAACGTKATTSGPSPTAGAPTPATTPAPAAAAATPGPAAATAAPQRGTLAISVVDQSGNKRSGVPVDIVGPATSRVVSDAAGIVKAVLPAGYYTATVVKGCTELLDVQDGGDGKAAVAPDQTATGTLRVTWRRRYAPGQPTDYAATDGKPTFTGSIPHWRPNVPYDVSFTMHDRCKGDAEAPNAPWTGWKFDISANAKVVDPGTGKADAQAHGKMRAMCTDKGVVNLAMSDAENPQEQSVDLVAMAAVASGRPNCSAD